MGKTLLDLSKSLKRKAKRIDQMSNELAKQVALDVISILVQVTPVDTSRALSNWQISLGLPASNEIEPYAPGSFGSTQVQSAAAAISKAKLWLASKRPGEPIFISNLVDYIVDLNEGTSLQAPRGFVQTAVMIAANRIESARFRI